MTAMSTPRKPEMPQPREFYVSAYTKAELLAVERPRGTAGCVVLQMHRKWWTRRENVWIDWRALPAYEERYLERWAR